MSIIMAASVANKMTPTPQEERKDKISKDIPVKFFIRITRRNDDIAERALLIAEAVDGRQWIFIYEDSTGYEADLTVCNFTPSK